MLALYFIQIILKQYRVLNINNEAVNTYKNIFKSLFMCLFMTISTPMMHLQLVITQ